MTIKKSELYSSLWASCDELRGGMDASQYKDYVLVMLFIKYVSDKYAGQPFAPVIIPEGASFKDMVALKGKASIGDDINKKIIAPLAEKNKLASMPDFNDPEKLGSGKDMVERLSNLIAIFENKALDFSKNRADGDDILGDAYEYLMRHFATESGKSKGQFYTPSEVSHVMSRIIGIGEANTSGDTTVYDPTCGSGSLLLKVADAAKTPVSLYGQEKDAATSALARMNMILHNNPTAVIERENTLSTPKFMNEGSLKIFDFVVANPPFSDKRWSTGVNTEQDPHQRFIYGVPPDKNGDYAYLLHIIRSLKNRGKGACILPHGVLFRGNAEAVIRENIVRKGLIKGIIGLPANLFYGTGIPACIIVIDKENAEHRKGIFMIDAGKGFVKDGNKNRLRERDIHKIVDVFNKQMDIDGYSRMVAFNEIEKNEFNLNIPRYIDSSEAEDLQDIAAHLLGDIPKADIEALHSYWAVCPALKSALFAPAKRCADYLSLQVAKDEIKTRIYQHPEFTSYMNNMRQVFQLWEQRSTADLKALQAGYHPKEIIRTLSEALLTAYADKALIDQYAVYQHLMSYWFEVMQDDAYLIAADGWQATIDRILEEKKNKDGNVTKTIDKGWACDLIPKSLVIKHYFSEQQQAIDALNAELETVQSQKTELEEEHGGEEGFFAELDRINKGSITARLKEIKGDAEAKPEQEILKQYLHLLDSEADNKKAVKVMENQLDVDLLDFYPTLTEEQIKQLVVDDKWMARIDQDVHSEMDRISQHLTQRIKALAERYEIPLSQQTEKVAELEQTVTAHLEKMGFVWH
ncbi:type I restriction-modification system subunit M [Beggiatoa leptomitoformis]|uniref:site-specific DNA-methyltransferase (adenine-specific) n=1 Tax=Beggiatoa leptomitoformis TaxID=288004 RepID=A0A2N9YCA4_9GAMM|nr:type I restriction-modification system subunit M [Beggiatoa leptomitoformis]ALG66639.1 type I restriction-modification system subunit M [Beggiatoa leptomitoformis]AUI68044.1 type I restriction-modification system subunit M [Beggiatoa leptomitoformis]